MDTQNQRLKTSVPILNESGTYLKAATLTWIGILCLVIAIPLMNYLRFPFISSVGILMLIGLAFWTLIRKVKNQKRSQQSEETVAPGLRTVKREVTYDQLKMDDQIETLNKQRML